MRHIAILGAGIMGRDLALNCAALGHRITLIDISSEALAATLEQLPEKLRGYQMINASLRGIKPQDLLSRILTTTGYAGLEDATWVIENVSEDWESKEVVYKQLAQVWHPNLFVGVNTSCTSVTRISRLLPQPDRVIGMHFMNPVPLKAAVEVIKGRLTSEETLSEARSLMKDLRKKPIMVQDFPGFVSNRLSHLLMNEAAFLVQDQVAEPAAIDVIFREGYGHAMGPLETADLIGLDTVLASLNVLFNELQDSKFRRCPLLAKMVEAGQLGRKSGKGFYDYASQ
jgi:3-hydroxybutyryl-CoA dehydrogenase